MRSLSVMPLSSLVAFAAFAAFGCGSPSGGHGAGNNAAPIVSTDPSVVPDPDRGAASDFLVALAKATINNYATPLVFDYADSQYASDVFDATLASTPDAVQSAVTDYLSFQNEKYLDPTEQSSAGNVYEIINSGLIEGYVVQVIQNGQTFIYNFYTSDGFDVMASIESDR